MVYPSCLPSANMADVDGSFVSPTADATAFPLPFAPGGLVSSFLNDLTVWKAVLTLFIAAVIYDQRMSAVSCLILTSRKVR